MKNTAILDDLFKDIFDGTAEERTTKNTAYWEKAFNEFSNTAEERKELIEEAFECSGDWDTQKIFCKVANQYGYFDNVDFALDMLNGDIGGGFLADSGAGDFLCNYGLLGDIDFVFEHIFDCINNARYTGYNLFIYMLQAFGLEKCLEKDPEKVRKLLEEYKDDSWIKEYTES